MAQIKMHPLRKAYKQADAAGKALLVEACGLEALTSSVMDRVKSLRDACDETGRNYDLEFSEDRTKGETPDETAYREWKIIAEALNEGQEVDFYNSKQRKYTIWVEYQASGRGLSLYGVYYADSYSAVGPRLVFVSEELAKYAFKQFPDTFNKFFQ
jgi:hypothetical protein